MMNAWRTVRVGTGFDDGNGRFAADLGHQFLYHAHQQVSREHPAQPGGDHLVAFLRQGVARKVGQHAQAIGGVFGAAGDDAVVTGA